MFSFLWRVVNWKVPRGSMALDHSAGEARRNFGVHKRSKRIAIAYRSGSGGIKRWPRGAVHTRSCMMSQSALSHSEAVVPVIRLNGNFGSHVVRLGRHCRNDLSHGCWPAKSGLSELWSSCQIAALSGCFAGRHRRASARRDVRQTKDGSD